MVTGTQAIRNTANAASACQRLQRVSVGTRRQRHHFLHGQIRFRDRPCLGVVEAAAVRDYCRDAGIVALDRPAALCVESRFANRSTT